MNIQGQDALHKYMKVVQNTTLLGLVLKVEVSRIYEL